jgi:hypothetical protein
VDILIVKRKNYQIILKHKDKNFLI